MHLFVTVIGERAEKCFCTLAFGFLQFWYSWLTCNNKECTCDGQTNCNKSFIVFCETTWSRKRNSWGGKYCQHGPTIMCRMMLLDERLPPLFHGCILMAVITVGVIALFSQTSNVNLRWALGLPARYTMLSKVFTHPYWLQVFQSLAWPQV